MQALLAHRRLSSGSHRNSTLLLATLLLVVALSIVSAQPSGLRIVASADRTTSLSRHGITWYFDSEVEYGRFANGDYWVIGPVTIVDIDPPSVDDGGWVRNGSMLDPSPLDSQGWNSEPSAGGWSANNNVGRPNGQNLSSENPLVIDAGHTLASSKSTEPAGSRHANELMSVLTVLSERPPEGSFRPPYSRGHKRLLNTSDIDWSYWADRRADIKSGVLSSMPSMSALERRIERVWLTIGGTWTYQRLRPTANMPDYGRAIAEQLGEIALVLALGFERHEIETLMIRYLQIGIDMYGATIAAENEGNLFNVTSSFGPLWSGGGGITQGFKHPMVFAAIMFDDDDMKKYANAGGTRSYWDSPNWDQEPGYPIHTEESQFNYVQQEDIDMNVSPGYPQTMVGVPDRDGNFMTSPSGGTEYPWGGSYRTIVTNSIIGHVLAAHMMELKELWNWDAIFDQIDRWVQAAETGMDTGYVDPGGTHTRLHGTNGVLPFAWDMWEAYREDYSPVWPAGG